MLHPKKNILSDIRNIINTGKNVAYVAANSASLMPHPKWFVVQLLGTLLLRGKFMS